MTQRIVLILPCCIGDVVMATATLQGLRRAYPDAHITWAVGRWSAPVVCGHPDLNAVLNTGSAANPPATPRGFVQLVRQLRAERYDTAVSLVRSPLMGLAVLASGIPRRIGLDSNGRGFAYNVRAAVNADVPIHESELYLTTLQAAGLDTTGCVPNVPVLNPERDAVRRLLAAQGITEPYFVLNPTGGSNPGMLMDSKRYPPQSFAVLAQRLAAVLSARTLLVGGPQDQPLLDAVNAYLPEPLPTFAGAFSFRQMGALAHDAHLYIGNDTGMTHLAAASQAHTVMLMGPSDPRRYGLRAAHTLTLWKPISLPSRGVAASAMPAWDWSRDGIAVEDACAQISSWYQTLNTEP